MKEELKSISPLHREKVRHVLTLFEQLDEAITAFQAKSGLGCKAGCGRCCESPQVEATVLEVLPLAYRLWEQGEAETTLAKIEAEQSGQCVFYKPDPLLAGQGRCSVYRWRPLLCRLFGFSTKQDKYNQPQLVTCATIKAIHAPACEKIEKSAALAEHAPRMQEYAMRTMNIDPGLGQRQLPINQAVKEAIEKVSLSARNLT